MAFNKYNLDRKSGLYFIIFIIIVALILVFYFSTAKNNANANNNLNQATNKSTKSNKQSVNVGNTNSSSINENINADLNTNEADINTNTALGGENLNQSVSDLNIEVFGYPNLERSENGEIINLNLGDGNGINIMPLSYKGMVRNSITLEKEETISVAGVFGAKLTGASAKDGSEISLIVVEYKDKLYHFSGNESYLNSLDNFINFN